MTLTDDEFWLSICHGIHVQQFNISIVATRIFAKSLHEVKIRTVCSMRAIRSGCRCIQDGQPWMCMNLTAASRERQHISRSPLSLGMSSALTFLPSTRAGRPLSHLLYSMHPPSKASPTPRYTPCLACKNAIMTCKDCFAPACSFSIQLFIKRSASIAPASLWQQQFQPAMQPEARP